MRYTALLASLAAAVAALPSSTLRLPTRQITDFAGYMFAYFTGNTIEGEKIYFAASNGNNALNWTELNDGQPALASAEGTKGLRDPFIIRSVEGDKFWILATDLSIGSGTSWPDSGRTGSRHLEIWESTDLVNWGTQRHVLVSPPTVGNTWAPEAIWHEPIGKYVVYWASSLYSEDDPEHTGPSYHRIMYSTTSDFVTFDEAQIWQDTGDSRYDSTIFQEGETFYRFTKDEGTSTGCADVITETSTDLFAQIDGWTLTDACIGRDAGLAAIEGPTLFRSNPGDVNGDKIYLFVDEFGGRGYLPLETTNIAGADWKLPSGEYNLPRSPRHGTVIPVTAEELARLHG